MRPAAKTSPGSCRQSPVANAVGSPSGATADREVLALTYTGRSSTRSPSPQKSDGSSGDGVGRKAAALWRSKQLEYSFRNDSLQRRLEGESACSPRCQAASAIDHAAQAGTGAAIAGPGAGAGGFAGTRRGRAHTGLWCPGRIRGGAPGRPRAGPAGYCPVGSGGVQVPGGPSSRWMTSNDSARASCASPGEHAAAVTGTGPGRARRPSRTYGRAARRRWCGPGRRPARCWRS